LKNKLLILLLIATALILSGCISQDDYLPVDPNDTVTVVVEIPSGSTAKSIGALLEGQGLIRSADAFVQKVKDMNAQSDLKAGKYKLSKALSTEEIVNSLTGGNIYVEGFKLVVPEGYEVVQIVARLVQDGRIDEAKFYEELKTGDFDYKFLTPADRETNLEGFLYPATYTFKVGATEHDIIDAMLKKFNTVFKEDYYTQAETLGLTVREVITMASIVEREAKLDTERPTVAGVFYNRLDIRMPLQSCATVQYILGERKEVLSYADIAIDNPYNTYKFAGLPPAPIASPGEPSIKAALYPEDTEYFYFVTTNLGDGSHYFSKTLKEHEAAIQKSKLN
jgi:UPF0755 protein